MAVNAQHTIPHEKQVQLKDLKIKTATKSSACCYSSFPSLFPFLSLAFSFSLVVIFILAAGVGAVFSRVLFCDEEVGRPLLLVTLPLLMLESYNGDDNDDGMKE